MIWNRLFNLNCKVTWVYFFIDQVRKMDEPKLLWRKSFSWGQDAEACLEDQLIQVFACHIWRSLSGLFWLHIFGNQSHSIFFTLTSEGRSCRSLRCCKACPTFWKLYPALLRRFCNKRPVWFAWVRQRGNQLTRCQHQEGNLRFQVWSQVLCTTVTQCCCSSSFTRTWLSWPSQSQPASDYSTNRWVYSLAWYLYAESSCRVKYW